jgi:hypothetical protein
MLCRLVAIPAAVVVLALLASALPAAPAEARQARLTPAHLPHGPLIAATAKRYGLPTPLFTALVWQESGFNAGALSPAGAQGLTQLMPGTAQMLGVTNPADPAQNLDGGARYLVGLLRAFRSKPLALAGYNAGPGAVQKYRGVPPYARRRTTCAWCSPASAACSSSGCADAARLIARAALAAALLLVIALPPAPASAARARRARWWASPAPSSPAGCARCPAAPTAARASACTADRRRRASIPRPWCAYFVSWSRAVPDAARAGGAGLRLRALHQGVGHADRALEAQAALGDLVMFPQHVGMVESVYRNGTLTTIEGNSSNRVARRWRRWGEASGYVRVATGGASRRPGAGPSRARGPR